jgi:hypothetical protein
MQAICKKYTYNHVHDATLLQDIMKELAGVDGVCELKDTPAPGTGTAHSVANSVSYLSAMMDANTDTDYSESAYAATSNSKLYKETHKPRGRKRHKSKYITANGRRTRKVQRSSRRITPAPLARNSTISNPIVYLRTNACGTRSIRDINSSPSVTN